MLKKTFLFCHSCTMFNVYAQVCRQDGIREIKPKIFDMPLLEVCAVDGSDLNIKCPSFLNIYVKSASYGREFAVKEICTGEKDGNPEVTCLDTEVVHQIGPPSRGLWNVTAPVSPLLANLDSKCNPPMKRELKVQYLCGIP